MNNLNCKFINRSDRCKGIIKKKFGFVQKGTNKMQTQSYKVSKLRCAYMQFVKIVMHLPTVSMNPVFLFFCFCFVLSSYSCSYFSTCQFKKTVGSLTSKNRKNAQLKVFRYIFPVRTFNCAVKKDASNFNLKKRRKIKGFFRYLFNHFI